MHRDDRSQSSGSSPIDPAEADNQSSSKFAGGATDENSSAPPAHLAARFYRSPLTRRKSSAHSSRRNSLSSAHSYASSHRRGSAATCQSHFVAQHLRRASIIESRRARLADRAAHVEQVRLRAALAKATPRGNSSTTEERALAAQLAKEKYLAKVAAACAEEVARAKRVAEEVKGRKLAEEARVRLEMEERQVEAEKRRAEYQRMLQLRRARRADSVDKKLDVLEEVTDVDEEGVSRKCLSTQSLDNETASKRVQRAWRLYKRKKPVSKFRQLDITALRSRNMSFEDMTAFVADPEIISSTTALLIHLGLQDSNDENAALNTRTFLSAFLISGHPVAVLNKKGAQEQDLIVKVTDLLTHFETAMDRLASWNNFTPNSLQLETLSQSYTTYTSAFAAWRIQDSSLLIEGMVASFVELDAIWQTVKDDTRGDVATEYREGIRDQQVMLLSRIRKLAGPDRADVLIKKAIRESRRKRPKKRPSAEVRPRGIESATPEATTSPTEPTIEDVGIPSPTRRSGTLIELFTKMPDNRVLAHELAINKDYRLEDEHQRVRDEIYRTLCNKMKAGVEAGQGTIWTLSAAENVRAKLLRMLRPNTSLHRVISETLDLADIKRQCERGVFSYESFFDFMASILPKLCAPFRDSEIKVLAADLQSAKGGDGLDVMIEKLFKLLRMVDVLSLDYTNFMISNAAPMLIKEAAGYEHRMFARDLEAGLASLENTKRWWQRSLTALNAEADRRDPDGIRNPSDRPSGPKVYTHALVETAICTGDFSPDAIPETLHLDRDRIEQIRDRTVQVVIIGAILLTTKNLLKRDVRSQWKKEASLLWELLDTEYFSGDPQSEGPSPAERAFSILDTAHNMPPSTREAVGATVDRFFDNARSSQAHCLTSGTTFRDPVLKLIFQRLKTHILARLSAESSVEQVRAATSTTEKLAASGMAELTPQVTAIVNLLEQVRRVDWESHGQWYGEIFMELGLSSGST